MSTTRQQYVKHLESRLTEGLNKQAISKGQRAAFHVETDHLENFKVLYGKHPRPLFLSTDMVEILLRPDREQGLAQFAGFFYSEAQRAERGAQPDEPSPSGWKPKYLAILEEALKQEWREPEAARKSYSELLRKSFETKPSVLALAIATSLIAALVTFYLTRQLEEWRGWIAFLMIFFVGYYPPFLVASSWATHRRGTHDKMTPNRRLFLTMIMAFVFFFEKLVFFLAVVLYALVLGLPWYLLSGLIVHWFNGSPWWMPPNIVIEVIAAGSLLLGVLVAISDVDTNLAFQPRKAIPELVAGLWHCRVWNIPLLANIVIGAVLCGAGPLGLLYDELPLAIAALGFAGLLHGLGLYKQPYDERLYYIVWIALARTDIRKGCLGSARWRLREIDTFVVKPPEVAHMIASALIRVADPDAQLRRDHSIAAELAKAAVAAEETDDYSRLWSASVKNSQVTKYAMAKKRLPEPNPADKKILEQIQNLLGGKAKKRLPKPNPADKKILEQIQNLLGGKLEQITEITWNTRGYVVNQAGAVIGLGFYNFKIDNQKLRELGLYGFTIDNQKLKELVELLSSLTTLTALDLSSNQLTDISSLTTLASLTWLDLRNNKLTNIPSLTTLTSLTELYLRSNKLTDISSLTTLTSLNELDLRNNQLTDISSLTNLTSLIELDLRNNQLTDISSLTNLMILTWLDLGDNKLTDISSLTTLTSLTTLDLRNNQLTDVSSLTTLTSLTKLDLSRNQLTDISSLTTLTSLNELDLSGNKLTDISSLTTLMSLNELNLGRNQIIQVPKELFERDWTVHWEIYKGVCGLNLYGNPLESPPVEIVKKGKKAVLLWYSASDA